MNLPRHSRALVAVVGAAIVLLLASAHFRLHDLGILGFYGDEETTAFPARSLAQGNGTAMPSGMPYYRALPMTILNSISVSVFGEDQEFSYRLPSALIGILTPVLLLLLLSRSVPLSIAVLTAFLLTFSEWHIITSREARMYAPFMLSFMATGFLFYRWVDSPNLARVATLSFLAVITLSIHTLGLLVVVFPAVWLAMQKVAITRYQILTLCVFSGITLTFYFGVNEGLITGAFRNWPNQEARRLALELLVDDGPNLRPIHVPGFSPIIAILYAIVVGLWLGRAYRNGLAGHWTPFRVVIVTGAACILAFAVATANLYASAILAISLALIEPACSRRLLKSLAPPAVVLALTGAVIFIYVLMSAGTFAIIEELLRYPFPYFVYFWEYSPVVTAFFWVGCLLLIFDNDKKCGSFVRVCALTAIGIVTALGLASEWGGMRYLIGAYPFFLTVASYTAYRIFEIVSVRSLPIARLASAILGSMLLLGSVQGYGVKAAIGARDIEYGMTAHPLTLGFQYYPDHKGAAEHVSENADDSDIIIVEDALQLFWYMQRELYWLSNIGATARFMYLDDAGVLRDFYVSSRVIKTTPREITCQSDGQRAWVITSAESEGRRHLSLSIAQNEWLTYLMEEFQPEYVGRDTVTKVYRLDCDQL